MLLKNKSKHRALFSECGGAALGQVSMRLGGGGNHSILTTKARLHHCSEAIEVFCCWII